MFKSRMLCLVLAMCCLAGLVTPALAAEVDCGEVYCFGPADFSQEETPLAGICITGLPEASTGTVMLGSRILRPGDILTAEQLRQLTFSPLDTEQDQEAVMTYLPIYDHLVDSPATMTISIRGKKDQAPVAEDFALETYKNLANDGHLKVHDPEGKGLTYTVTRQPRRGEVTLRDDGSFTYTPKKNKVGTDSFTYTATDPAGNVSREATVTVTILKPTDASTYSDTADADCRFEAEWLKNTGIFEGEKLGGEACFQPEKAVTAGEFLTMLVKVLELPSQETGYSALAADTPAWLKPYLAAALRCGITAGLPQTPDHEEALTGAQAAVMLQNALALTVSTGADLTENAESLPVWAVSAVNALADNGIHLDAQGDLTRSDAAKILYRVSKLAADAPGMILLRSR